MSQIVSQKLPQSNSQLDPSINLAGNGAGNPTAGSAASVKANQSLPVQDTGQTLLVMPSRILIIDDDEELDRLLMSYLKQFQFEVSFATKPSEGFAKIQSFQPDLIVLDVMLPEMNGFDVCREIRRHSQIPIIMLTARGDLSDRVVGLEIGADDYLPKPYEPRELVARINSVLRRTNEKQLAQPSPPAQVLKSDELRLDLSRADAFLSGVSLELTGAEFSILSTLMKNPGKTLSRDQITQALRGTNWDSLDRTVDMVISRLRAKLTDDSKHPRYLKTMWGEGYRFVGAVTTEPLA